MADSEETTQPIAEETTEQTTNPVTETSSEPTSEPTTGDTTETPTSSDTKIVLKQEALGILRKMYSDTVTAAGNLLSKPVSSDATMQALKNIGLESGFANSYDSVIKGVTSGLNNIVNTMLNAYESVSGIDLNIYDLIPKTDNGKKSPSGGGGGGSQSGHDKVADQQKYKAQIESYSKMSLSDLSKIANILRETAEKYNISVSDLLNDEKYENVLKQVLLENNLDEVFLSLIKETDSATTQKVLRDIMGGQAEQIAVGIDDDTLTTLNYYLVNIAKQYNLSLAELLSEDNSKLLKTSLSQFNKILDVISGIDSRNFESEINKIYLEDTNDIGKALIKLNIDINGGINDNNYSYEKLEKLGKFALFAINLSNYDYEELFVVLQSIYKASGNNGINYTQEEYNDIEKANLNS